MWTSRCQQRQVRRYAAWCLVRIHASPVAPAERLATPNATQGSHSGLRDWPMTRPRPVRPTSKLLAIVAATVLFLRWSRPRRTRPTTSPEIVESRSAPANTNGLESTTGTMAGITRYAIEKIAHNSPSRPAEMPDELDSCLTADCPPLALLVAVSRFARSECVTEVNPAPTRTRTSVTSAQWHHSSSRKPQRGRCDVPDTSQRPRRDPGRRDRHKLEARSRQVRANCDRTPTPAAAHRRSGLVPRMSGAANLSSRQPPAARARG